MNVTMEVSDAWCGVGTGQGTLSIISCCWNLAQRVFSHHALLLVCLFFLHDSLKNLLSEFPDTYLHFLSISFEMAHLQVPICLGPAC